MVGLTLSLFGGGASAAAVVRALLHVMLALLAAGLATLVLMRFLPRLPFARRLVLTTAIGPAADVPAPPTPSTSSAATVGTTITPLRPAGIASIGGRRMDVVSQGDFIAAGEAIEVVLESGSRVVVRRHRGPTSTGENT